MKCRKSNIEILRILSMLFIVNWHILIALKKNQLIDTNSFEYNIISAITVVGVNCFILISGYFGIKFNWRSFIQLCLSCAFYNFTLWMTAIHFIGTKQVYSIADLFLPIGTNQWWFITTYIMLYMLSPFINTSINNMNIKHLINTIVIFSFIIFYICWLFKNTNNESGHSFLQFIYLYLLGRCIKIIPFNKINTGPKLKIHNKLKYSGYLILGIIIILCIILNAFIIKSYRYNNPIVIIQSVAIFILFLKLKISNVFINFIASNILSVYLIHTHKSIWPLFIIIINRIHFIGNNIEIEWCIYILFSIALIFICSFLEWTRSSVFLFLEKRIVNIHYK